MAAQGISQQVVGNCVVYHLSSLRFISLLVASLFITSSSLLPLALLLLLLLLLYNYKTVLISSHGFYVLFPQFSYPSHCGGTGSEWLHSTCHLVVIWGQAMTLMLPIQPENSTGSPDRTAKPELCLSYQCCLGYLASPHSPMSLKLSLKYTNIVGTPFRDIRIMMKTVSRAANQRYDVFRRMQINCHS